LLRRAEPAAETACRSPALCDDFMISASRHSDVPARKSRICWYPLLNLARMHVAAYEIGRTGVAATSQRKAERSSGHPTNSCFMIHGSWWQAGDRCPSRCLDPPNARWWPDRQNLSHAGREFEARSVSYLVCTRLGIDTASDEYMAGYVRRCPATPPISLDRVMKSVWLLEQMGRAYLGLRKIPNQLSAIGTQHRNNPTPDARGRRS
jgi:hypothetical protein